MEAKPKYIGEWQFKDVIKQKLAGPIGQGEVQYPNGDRFEGYFCLSYQSIDGTAYTAHGKYTFADGSYIEDAWIETFPDDYPLYGVFRIHHPDGTESIAMFHGPKSGLELFLGDQPSYKFWYKGEELTPTWEYDVKEYEIDNSKGEDSIRLTVVLKREYDTWTVIMKGGKLEANSYGNYNYAPGTEITVYDPDGDSRDYLYGAAPREFRPYDGYLVYHYAEQAICRSERWENGQRIEEEEWERDMRVPRCVTLPHPLGYDETIDAFVWVNGHIQYKGGKFVYDGEIANDRPEGKGVLVGGGERYEGIFYQGVFLPEDHFDGEIKLHFELSSKHWNIDDDGEWKTTEEERIAKLGKLDIRGFWDCEIVRISKDLIVIVGDDGKCFVTPDQPGCLTYDYEHEDSDGCVYEGACYHLKITWVKE